jgi:hypothetical protein
VVGQDMVRVGALGLGVGVDQRGGQPGDRVQQGVLGADGYFVGLHGGDVRATTISHSARIW